MQKPEDNLPTPKMQVLSLLSQVSYGKISSYGAIANNLNMTARTVGFILNGLTKTETAQYPWHRIVNKQGFISSSKMGERGIIQAMLLKEEGIEIIDFQIIHPENYWYTFH